VLALAHVFCRKGTAGRCNAVTVCEGYGFGPKPHYYVNEGERKELQCMTRENEERMRRKNQREQWCKHMSPTSYGS